ncbi:MAG: amino acid ABC transporter substrate-binding protein [Clostridia bacterium]|nr:amino acid ABC transporter substrate-binding protein [Oscillospiraceae bacterium]MBR6748070.1 amino acid ABC transporter substrate-binding protein [Clostridia bacterium]
MIADGAAAEISKKWFGADILFKDIEYKEDTTIAEDDNSLQAILDKGTFVLGLDDSFPPMGYRDDNNNIVGFDIDLATEVCKRLGVELVLQPIDWDSKEMELSTGKIDCIWNGMTITDERVETMFIPAAYIANRQVIIVGNNSGIAKKADLKGKIIGLQKGSSSLEALESDPIHAEVKEIVEFADNISAFQDLKAGRVEAFVVDEVAGRYIMENN